MYSEDQYEEVEFLPLFLHRAFFYLCLVAVLGVLLSLVLLWGVMQDVWADPTVAWNDGGMLFFYLIMPNLALALGVLTYLFKQLEALQ